MKHEENYGKSDGSNEHQRLLQNLCRLLASSAILLATGCAVDVAQGIFTASNAGLINISGKRSLLFNEAGNAESARVKEKLNNNPLRKVAVGDALGGDLSLQVVESLQRAGKFEVLTVRQFAKAVQEVGEQVSGPLSNEEKRQAFQKIAKHLQADAVYSIDVGEMKWDLGSSVPRLFGVNRSTETAPVRAELRDVDGTVIWWQSFKVVLAQPDSTRTQSSSLLDSEIQKAIASKMVEELLSDAGYIERKGNEKESKAKTKGSKAKQ